MSALTYKNIKTIIEGFGSSHRQINNTAQGDLYDANASKKIDGVYLLYDIINNSPYQIASGNKRGQIYNISCWIVDRVSGSNNPSNEDEAKNECDLIAKDLLSYFENFGASGYTDKNVRLQLEGGWNIEFVDDRMSGLYAGVLLTFSLYSNFSYRRCIIPMDNQSSTDQIFLETLEAEGIVSIQINMTGDYELPAAESNTPGYIMINRTGSDLTITTANAYTIEGETSITIKNGETRWLTFDGTDNWNAI